MLKKLRKKGQPRPHAMSAQAPSLSLSCGTLTKKVTQQNTKGSLIANWCNQVRGKTYEDSRISPNPRTFPSLSHFTSPSSRQRCVTDDTSSAAPADLRSCPKFAFQSVSAHRYASCPNASGAQIDEASSKSPASLVPGKGRARHCLSHSGNRSLVTVSAYQRFS